MLRLVSTVLWSSFLVAIVAEGVFFSFVDPIEWAESMGHDIKPIAAYTIGFLFFWACCAAASALACYLIHEPRK